MNRHLSADELAAFIDETLTTSDREIAARHVRGCADCRRAYLEAGRLAGDWGVAPEGFPSRPDLISLGREVPETLSKAKNRTLSRPRTRRWLQVGALAAVLAIAVVGVNTLRMGTGQLTELEDLLYPVRSAVLQASNDGPFVLPGVGDSLEPTESARRSGYVPIADSLQAALRELYQRYNQDQAAGDVAVWLAAGQIATGQIDAARDLLNHARNLRPEEPNLATLDAIVHYIDGYQAQAEELLRLVLERQPQNDTARINLALVLREAGRRDEAAGLLRQVVADRPGSGLAMRAQSLLDALLGS